MDIPARAFRTGLGIRLVTEDDELILTPDEARALSEELRRCALVYDLDKQASDNVLLLRGAL